MKPIDELTSHCIRCGFCLESCPTFVETGEETESPRGRIYLARSADEGKIPWASIKPHIDQCLGCRACEPACPSGVEYGQILEIARDRIEREHPNRAKSLLLGGLSTPWKMKLQLAFGKMLPGHRIPSAMSRMLSAQEPEADRPNPQNTYRWLPLEDSSLPMVRGEVYLLEGCVMRVLFPGVHQATRRLLRRVGYTVREVKAGCCGSLHLHVGYLDEAHGLAGKLVAAMPGDLPVIVDSAGCGSTMKEYSNLGSQIADLKSFGKRVSDISEFLAANGLVQQLHKSKGLTTKATYHDACHLAHSQRVKTQPRQLLAAVPSLEMVDLPESDMCCGSAGIYNLTQPQMARKLLERKWANIESTGAQMAVLGNPGCHAWIAQAAREHGSSMKVLHTSELLESSFSGLPAELA
jgi:glycolate oxidase iron-sulfur subunit